MDNDDLNKALNSFKSLVDNGQIPDNLKDILSNFQSSSANQSASESSSSESNESNVNLNNLFNTTNNNNNNNDNSNNSNEINFDIGTLLKMKKLVSSMNSKNDPRANLLYSLKPYLRESRKGKLDQYVNLLNMTKVATLFKNENTEKNDDV